jgi:hypothetical protein
MAISWEGWDSQRKQLTLRIQIAGGDTVLTWEKKSPHPHVGNEDGRLKAELQTEA